MSITRQDQVYMSRAIKLAQQGRFTTSPNPNVGCVIVNNGQVIGEGFHLKAGQGHAEVNALASVASQDDLKGATAYVTLEPCSHYGRTPPCAEALVKVGVARVVIGMVDPNPKVAGNGIKILTNNGIEVDYPCLEQDCIALNPGFIKRMTDKKPFVTAKLACSIDGRTAMDSGESQWITGPDARADVQQYRASSCAIITGSGTVNIDQPKLNVRAEQLTKEYPLSEIRQPLRVVIDNQHQVKADNKFFDIKSPVLLVSNKERENNFPSHVELVNLDSSQAKVDLDELLAFLAKREINNVWLEAGAKLAGAFLQQGLIDELIIYQAPKLMGENTFGLVNMPSVTQLNQASEWQYKNVTQIGNDLKLILQKRH